MIFATLHSVLSTSYTLLLEKLLQNDWRIKYIVLYCIFSYSISKSTQGLCMQLGFVILNLDVLTLVQTIQHRSFVIAYPSVGNKLPCNLQLVIFCLISVSAWKPFCFTKTFLWQVLRYSELPCARVSACLYNQTASRYMFNKHKEGRRRSSVLGWQFNFNGWFSIYCWL